MTDPTLTTAHLELEQSRTENRIAAMEAA